MKGIFKIVLLCILAASAALAQQEGAKYDEGKAGEYSLPDPLMISDGNPVRDAASWMRRREEILAQYREQVYGYSLLRPAEFPRGLRR